MSCIKVVLKDGCEHLHISVGIICGIQKPILHYLMDNLGRKLYDSKGELLLAKK